MSEQVTKTLLQWSFQGVHLHGTNTGTDDNVQIRRVPEEAHLLGSGLCDLTGVGIPAYHLHSIAVLSTTCIAQHPTTRILNSCTANVR